MNSILVYLEMEYKNLQIFFAFSKISLVQSAKNLLICTKSFFVVFCFNFLILYCSHFIHISLNTSLSISIVYYEFFIKV